MLNIRYQLNDSDFFYLVAPEVCLYLLQLNKCCNKNEWKALSMENGYNLYLKHLVSMWQSTRVVCK